MFLFPKALQRYSIFLEPARESNENFLNFVFFIIPWQLVKSYAENINK